MRLLVSTDFLFAMWSVAIGTGNLLRLLDIVSQFVHTSEYNQVNPRFDVGNKTIYTIMVSETKYIIPPTTRDSMGHLRIVIGRT